MLSEKRVSRPVSKFDRPLLPEPMTYRVVFSKVGNLQFFSHLDLQRTWQRVLVRASIPMWYTQGFNPHSKIVFGIPLSVGTEGTHEMVDLRIDRAITSDEMRDQLNAELTDEMQVSAVYIPTTAFSDIAYATYTVTVSDPSAASVDADAVEALFAPGAAPILMTKRTKSGDREMDILPLIREIHAAREADGTLILHATLAAGGSANLSPEFLVAALREKLGMLTDTEHPDVCWYRILRTGFLCADGSEFR